MSDGLALLLGGGLIERQAQEEALSCNARTARFGLSLSPEAALSLASTRAQALSANGRIEFGGGTISKIILAFRDSPYIFQQNYEETIAGLLEIFYTFKGECCELISDDDLISAMKDAFDGVCQGDLELLSGRELYKLAKRLRNGAEDASDEY